MGMSAERGMPADGRRGNEPCGRTDTRQCGAAGEGWAWPQGGCHLTPPPLATARDAGHGKLRSAPGPSPPPYTSVLCSTLPPSFQRPPSAPWTLRVTSGVRVGVAGGVVGRGAGGGGRGAAREAGGGNYRRGQHRAPPRPQGQRVISHPHLPTPAPSSTQLVGRAFEVHSMSIL